MTKILSALIVWAAMVGLGILIMIFGWGLVPQSWGWILGGGVVSTLIAAVFQMGD